MNYDYIQGEKFYNVADFIYTSDRKSDFIDYNRLKNTFNFNKFKKGEKYIIYTHTLYVNDFFRLISDKNEYLFILISHNSDINVDNKLSEIPINIIKWFAQNVDFNDKRIISIPIGLENSRWFPEQKKIEKLNKKQYDIKKCRNLLYINHNIKTNPNERSKPYVLFKNKNWVTLEQGKNGSGYDNYIDNMFNHKFVLCPNGNGIDTHRLWECLYLKTIPIVKNNINNKFYSDLPIIMVNEWDEITEDFLNSEYDRINKTNNWNYNKLNFSYWDNLIKKEK